MSTALAIAATTRVMSAVIDQTIQAAGIAGVLGAPPYLTTRPPDQLETGASEAGQLALFLYHVTHNPGWREVGLPSRTAAGDSTDRPPLALDLHYLLIAYGEAEYVPQLLLGLGMQALHETPFLYRQQITNVFSAPGLTTLDQAMATADLADQVEMIKITPEPLTTEDLSKLWTAFGGKFRPSAGYQATVVLIQSTAPVPSALPVQTRNLVVIPLQRPVVDAVAPLFVPWSPTAKLTLTGSNLAGDTVSVVFDAAPAAPQVPTPLAPGGSSVSVPLPAGLPAGINTLRAVQQVVVVQSEPARTIVDSNVALFYLQPVIRQSPPGTYLVSPGAGGTVKVQLDPALASTQKVQLLLNEVAPPAGQSPLSFTFDAVPAQIAGNSATFTTFTTRPGAYWVRVRVDGAESVPDPANPPQVTL
ncbi:MAG TPA: DUF4255 domain-containing protein [Actinomycetota bacterium]|nr:DUF4255 domain-containing protein [Actinomycetota bacterium]